MGMPLRRIFFSTPLAGTPENPPVIIHFGSVLDGKVDRENGCIRGVSMITAGVVARGHELEIDDTTVKQLFDCAVAKGQVPVKLNHKSGIVEVCGYLDNHRVSGNKVLSDWHLLKSHSEYETTLEKAERMPGCFGLSAAFVGEGAAVKGRKMKAARCTELLSVDCVTQPAANPDGLFEAIIDPPVAFDTRGVSNMPKLVLPKPADPANPTNAELFALISTLGQRIEAQDEEIESLRDGAEGDPEMTAEELAQVARLNDAQLAQLGLTRAEVNQAISDAMAGADESEGEVADEGEGEGEMAEASAAAADGTSLESVQDVITYFESRIRKAADKRNEVELQSAFEVIDRKVTMLAAHNEELEAANGALREQLMLSAGGRPLPASGEANILFESNVEGLDPNTFEFQVNAMITELTAKDKNLSETGAQAKAVRLCVGKYPALYAEYRGRGGKIELSRK